MQGRVGLAVWNGSFSVGRDAGRMVMVIVSLARVRDVSNVSRV